MKRPRTPGWGASAASRRRNVGSLADSEGNGPTEPGGNPPEQARSGAPGWNRTSDTRSRKHAAGVTDCRPPGARVLHRPSFCTRSVLGRAEAWRAVVSRLVGIAAAWGVGSLVWVSSRRAKNSDSRNTGRRGGAVAAIELLFTLGLLSLLLLKVPLVQTSGNAART
jgi:hypothetical protein